MKFTNGFDPNELNDHFQRHGKTFSARTESEYEDMADNFMGSPIGSMMLECVREDGDLVRYNQATQEFGIVSANNIIRTYFKPDPRRHGKKSNLSYFHEQCGRVFI